MTFLTPIAAAWLVSLPVLVWLWRLASSRRQTTLPSLVPFERLVRRAAHRRTRVPINPLFWLQAAALALLALAMTQPLWPAHRVRTVLLVLDTSASMQAKSGGHSMWDEAKRLAWRRIAAGGRGERFALVGSVPIASPLAEPTADRAQLRAALDSLAPVDRSGNLALAERIGRGLLRARPDASVIVTDEPAPERAAAGGAAKFAPADVISVGKSLPNAGIVGVDTREPLCAASESQIAVTVQNFADQPQELAVSVSQQGREVAHQVRSLAAGASEPMRFDVPQAGGEYDVRLVAARNALEADDRATVVMRGQAALPVLVVSDSQRFIDTVGRWLDACANVTWQPQDLGNASAPLARLDGDASQRVVVTDRPDLAEQASVAMLFARASTADRSAAVRWLVETAHPVSEYLESLDVVPTLLARGATDAGGEPMVWGLLRGQRMPLVTSATGRGRRMVRLAFDPTGPESVAPVLVFLNSLRWLSGLQASATTGEPLVVGPFGPGAVRVRGPDGRTTTVSTDNGWVRYEATDRAGRYEFSQGSLRVERVVNFLDPIESDLQTRASTLKLDAAPVAREAVEATREQQPMMRWLLRLIAMLLLAEWVLYATRWHQRLARRLA